MPPRNSNTKVYKKYNIRNPSNINISIDTGKFIEPLIREDVMDNKECKAFNKFKEEQALKGKINSIDYKNPDPRYSDSDWFRNKT